MSRSSAVDSPSEEVRIRRRLFALRGAACVSAAQNEEIRTLFLRLVEIGVPSASLLSLGATLGWPADSADLLARRLIADYQNKRSDPFVCYLLQLPRNDVSRETLETAFEALARHGYAYDLGTEHQAIPWALVKLAVWARRKGTPIPRLMDRITHAKSATEAAREDHVKAIENQRLTRSAHALEEMERRLEISLPPALFRRWALDDHSDRPSLFLAPPNCAIVRYKTRSFFVFAGEALSEDEPFQYVELSEQPVKSTSWRKNLERKFYALPVDALAERASDEDVGVFELRAHGQVYREFEYDGYEFCRYQVVSATSAPIAATTREWIALLES